MRLNAAASILVLAGLGVTGVSRAGVLEDRKKSQAFLEAAAKEEGAVKTSSGLIYKTLTPGTGESPICQPMVPDEKTSAWEGAS